MYTYISEQSSNQSDVTFGLYGTNSFQLVWETACGVLFKNERTEISKYMELPEWIIGNTPVSYKGDLIPDIVSFRDIDSNNCAMYILDGKYYLIREEKGKLEGIPGIQDVIKQYIYNAALRNYIHEKKISAVANAFLIPKLESEDQEKDIDKIGRVPYWTMQKGGFKELPDVQILKIKPEIVWNHYLNNKFLYDQFWTDITATPTENYLYHNEGDESILIPTYEKTHIFVGLLSNEYFKCIEEKGLKEIWFYFAATDKFKIFPMHPYIDFCTRFIGYTEEGSSFITGKLDLLQNGRCRIDEISAEELHKEKDVVPYAFDKAKTDIISYYKVKIHDIEITENPAVGISDIAELNRMIKIDGFNDVLSKNSPKVIGY